MKHKGLYLLWCVCVALFSLSAVAQDEMTATMVPTEDAGKWILEINLENLDADNLTAFQLDLVLPEGFTAEETSAAPSLRLTDHSLLFQKRFGTTYRMMAYSLSAAPIVGNSGCVASVTISADEATVEGDYQASLSNILFSDRLGAEYEFEDATFVWNYAPSVSTTILPCIAKGTFATVYTLGGVCIAKNVDATWVKTHLKAGVYIINGRKYCVGRK